MSDAEAQQQEPSMEEILASIRRIISEDGEEGEEQASSADAAGSAEAPAEEAPAPELADDDVLELTNVVDEDDKVVSTEDSAASEQDITEADEGLELADHEAPDAAAVEAEPEPVSADEGDGLLSEDKADAAADAFANLMGAMSVATPLGAEGKTLEDIVMALMRPLLKQWLDANLPPLVERVVRDEIERVVGRARDR